MKKIAIALFCVVLALFAVACKNNSKTTYSFEVTEGAEIIVTAPTEEGGAYTVNWGKNAPVEYATKGNSKTAVTYTGSTTTFALDSASADAYKERKPATGTITFKAKDGDGNEKTTTFYAQYTTNHTEAWIVSNAKVSAKVVSASQAGDYVNTASGPTVGDLASIAIADDGTVKGTVKYYKTDSTDTGTNGEYYWYAKRTTDPTEERGAGYYAVIRMPKADYSIDFYRNGASTVFRTLTVGSNTAIGDTNTVQAILWLGDTEAVAKQYKIVIKTGTGDSATTYQEVNFASATYEVAN